MPNPTAAFSPLLKWFGANLAVNLARRANPPPTIPLAPSGKSPLEARPSRA